MWEGVTVVRNCDRRFVSWWGGVMVIFFFFFFFFKEVYIQHFGIVEPIFQVARSESLQF